MTTTTTRAKNIGTTGLALVISVNPFSSIKHPIEGAAAAFYQRYTMLEHGRMHLVKEDRYLGPDAEQQAAEYFDRKHGE